MSKRDAITIVPTQHYVPGIPAIEYSGSPDDVITSADGLVSYSLAELLAFNPPVFVTKPSEQEADQPAATGADTSEV